jgi:FkbM family methyltransferase
MAANLLEKIKPLYRLVYRKSLKLRYFARSKSSFHYLDPQGINWLISRGSTLDQTMKKRNGMYDPAINMLISKCDLSFVAVDVGSNAGYWTLPLASKFAKVVSFEAEPSMREKLLSNIDLNNDLKTKICVVDKAASDSIGELDFFVRSSIDGDALLNRGLSSLAVSDGADERIRVASTTVSAECQNLDRRVGLLKIDVEGAEFLVLRGSENILRRDCPLVYWEATLSLDAKYGRSNVKDCFEFLTSLGYEHSTLDDYSGWKRINGYEDFVCLGRDLDVLSEFKKI